MKGNAEINRKNDYASKLILIIAKTTIQHTDIPNKCLNLSI